MLHSALTKLAVVALAVALTLTACAPTEPKPAPAGTRDAGVQLFEWNWESIGRECTDSLGPNGFGWVLTSPPNEHIVGKQWWTSYQPVSYRIESRLGTREQFAAMVAECEAAGVEIIADAVINHMAASGPGVGIAGTPYDHYDYPGLYGRDDFHACTESASGGIQNYKNRGEVQNCELLGLADLRTDTTAVQDRIVAYLEDLLSLGVAGFRIDAAKHMPADDVAAIVGRLPDETRIMHEVIRGFGEPIQPEEYVASGDVFEFGFARDVRSLVESASLSLGNEFGVTDGYVPSDKAIVFVENHDTERNGESLTWRDGNAYLLATAFTLAQPYGTPVLFSGYAFATRDDGPPQEGPRILDADCAEYGGGLAVTDAGVESPTTGSFTCQHRWPLVTGMVNFRSAVGDAPITDEWSDAWAYAFGRGDLGFAVFNAGEDSVSRTFDTSLVPGRYTEVISGAEVSVDGEGRFTATIPGMSVFAIHVGDEG